MKSFFLFSYTIFTYSWFYELIHSFPSLFRISLLWHHRRRRQRRLLDFLDFFSFIHTASSIFQEEIKFWCFLVAAAGATRDSRDFSCSTKFWEVNDWRRVRATLSMGKMKMCFLNQLKYLKVFKASCSLYSLFLLFVPRKFSFSSLTLEILHFSPFKHILPTFPLVFIWIFLHH